LQVYTVEPGKVREWLVLAVNQYAAGYRTEQSEPPQVRLREGLRPGWAIVPVAGLP
jgi:hypothetical protein